MKTKSNYAKSRSGILTVGQLLNLLEGQDKDTMVVIGNDGWYDNIDGVHLVDESEEYTCVTFEVGKPYDTRQG